MKSSRPLSLALPEIVAALSTVKSTAEASHGSGLPECPGLYAWWVRDAEVLPDVPLDVRAEGYALVYVGVARSRGNSTQTLRSRVLGKHLRGVIGSSTLRRSLAALLWEKMGWEPFWSTDRASLSSAHNQLLKEWMEENLRVAWIPCPEPWVVETEVITLMSPPLNLKGNKKHPYYKTLKAARSKLDVFAGNQAKVAFNRDGRPANRFTVIQLADELRADAKKLRRSLRDWAKKGRIEGRSGATWSWPLDSPDLNYIRSSWVQS